MTTTLPINQYRIKCSVQPDMKGSSPKVPTQTHFLTLPQFVSLVKPYQFSLIFPNMWYLITSCLCLKCLLRVPYLWKEHLIIQDQVQCLLYGSFLDTPYLRSNRILPLLYSHSSSYSTLSLQVVHYIATVCLFVCVPHQTGKTSKAHPCCILRVQSTLPATQIFINTLLSE